MDPESTIKTYTLSVKIGDAWHRVTTIQARDHADAFRLAVWKLNPEHFDKEIRLEQVKPEETRG